MTDFSFKRAKRELAAAALTVDLDGAVFTLAPSISLGVIEAYSRAEAGQLAGIFDAIKALLVSVEPSKLGAGAAAQARQDEAWRQFLALDYDQGDLEAVLTGMIGVYGDPGKSSGSAGSSSTAGPNSTPTSAGTTDSTSRPGGSEEPSLSVA